LSGSENILFKNLGIKRLNGTGDILIDGASKNILFENCSIGNFNCPENSNNDNIRLIGNNFNASDLKINNCSNVIVNNNKIRRSLFFRSNHTVISNNVFVNQNTCEGDLRNIYVNESQDILVQGNNTFMVDCSAPRSIEISNSRNVNVYDNNILTKGGSYNWEMGIYLSGGNSRNIKISRNNIINDGYGTEYGIYMDSGDSMFITNNKINGVKFIHSGIGITALTGGSTLFVDSNFVENYLSNGIYLRAYGYNQWKARYNRIKSIQETGIWLYSDYSGMEISYNRIYSTYGVGIKVDAYNSYLYNNFINSVGFGYTKGIILSQNSSGSKLYFNSVNIKGRDLENGKAIEINNGSGFEIKNNIFSNTGGGFAAYFNSNLNNSQIDYNLYYSSGRKLNFLNGNSFNKLSDFTNVSQTDSHSLSINPFFISDTSPICSHVKIKNAGFAVTGINNDIDNYTRSNNPDIGAKEIFICPNDAGINEFVDIANPVPLGNNLLKVELQNQGTNTINNALIYWQINGINQTPFSWSGSLGYKQSIVISIGNLQVFSNGRYSLKAWVQSVNNQSDCNKINDTCKINDLGRPMCGIYTIGGNLPDYPNFNAAVHDLNTLGISCPVVFKVRNGSYNEQVNISEIQGASNVNDITFLRDDDSVILGRNYVIPESLRQTMVAYYPLSNNFIDSSGNGHDAIPRNNVIFVKDRFGKENGACYFNNSSYLSALCNVSEKRSTISFYFNSTNSNCGLFVVSGGELGQGGNDRDICISNGDIYCRLWSNEALRSSGRNYADGNWHHLVYQFDDSLNIGQRVYLDGILLFQGLKKSSDFDWQDKIMIGFSNDVGYANCSLDDIAIWDRALDLNEIDLLKQGIYNYSELHYRDTNYINDYTLKLSGTDYIKFKNLGIIRSNGSLDNPLDVILSNGVHHVAFENCYLNGFSNAENSMDSFLIFRNNSMVTRELSLRQPYSQNNQANNFIIENNYLAGINLNNSKNVIVKNNRLNSDPNSFFYGLSLDNVNQLLVDSNRFWASKFRGDSNVIIKNNITYTYRDDWGVLLENCFKTQVENNFINNNYGIVSYGYYSDSVLVKKNTLVNSQPDFGYGMQFFDTRNNLLVDSNSVTLYTTEGIRCRTPENSNCVISNNKILRPRDNGVILDGDGTKCINNRILGSISGNGILVLGNNSFVSNNYIQAQGLGIAKGLSVRETANGSKIVFNSVNITSTDLLNGIAFELLGGNGYVVKNNIFNNYGGGYCVSVSQLPTIRDWDYNCYNTSGQFFANLNGVNYSSLPNWSSIINGDVNSKKVDPVYESTTSLQPFQKQLNGAGIAAGNVLLDIDGEIRNQQAPDVGAQEFMVDFGVTRLESPTNECSHTSTEPVSVFLRQYGDIPFVNIKIAYSVNNGPIYYDTIPGSISNDLVYTFTRTQDLSVAGSYYFKIWLVDNADDNPNNDTLYALRVNKPSPIVDFSYITQCANKGVPFSGTAYVSSGFIDRYEWEFGDLTSGFGQNPIHNYELASTYQVVMRAYSDQGCFSQVSKSILLNPTPDANFNVSNVCFGNAIVINNLTQMAGGAGNITNSWNYGDGSFGSSQTHLYNNSGTYNITLTAISDNGCKDTLTKQVVINPLPVLSTNLDSSYIGYPGYVSLIGSPAGGIFTGPGIVGDNFFPSAAGSGDIVITYSYTNPLTGCIATINKTVHITALPKILSQPESITSCQGNNVSLNVLASGTSIGYQWYKNNQLILGANTQNLILNQIDQSNNGNYYVKVFNLADTIISNIVSLTVNPTSSSTNSVKLCNGNSYTLPSGSIVNSAGVYTSVLTNSKGCDSVITTNVYTGNSTTSTQSVNSCNSYSWNGQNYTQSGIYTWIGTNNFGCDSIATLNLTITPNTNNSTSTSSCDSYTWLINGQVYTQSGNYTSISGCHTEILNLTITPSTSNKTIASACDSYTWIINGQVYTQSGSYTSTNGCHSEILNLTIIPRTTNSSTATACGSYVWAVNSQTYTSSGNYTYVNGCNTQILNLTINANSVAPSTITASSSTITSGSTVTLSVSGGSLGTGATWKWYSGSCGGTLIGTGASISLVPTATTTYYVRSEGTCNVTTCASVTVTVQSATTCGPTAIVSNAAGNAVCSGRSVVLNVQGTLGAGATWKWYKGGCGSGTSIGSGTSTTVTPTCNTTYYVRSEGGTCGNTTCKSITIAITAVPSTPGTISGSSSGLCSSIGVRYTIAAVSGATSYVWTVPTGATIVSGQGSTSITVNYGSILGTNSSCGSSSVCVKAVNACGSSANKCLSNSLLPTGSCGTITGPSTACTNINANYSCVAVSGATVYTWAVPTGWSIISGQGTTVMLVKPGTTQGTVKVTPSNSCGSGSASSKSVKATSCSTPIYTKGAVDVPVETTKDITIWPNPANSYFNLSFVGSKPDKIELFDVTGKLIFSSGWKSMINVSRYNSGFYYLRIYIGGLIETKKLEIIK
jgi:PKD-like domain/Ig-like domain CHU_C associated/Secretion system C-terminal sorting domain/Right handed beta helix region/PKD domain